MLAAAEPRSPTVQAQFALALRIGLGSVFIIGGIAKLERLLTPAKSQAMVDEYVGPLGYINQTFLDWLFASPLGALLTPWNFLTALSAFELVCGVMLVAGLMVRPLAVVKPASSTSRTTRLVRGDV
ncbi:MAG: DoxX family membrane protein, partial [Hyphomicrobium sp.]